MAESLFPSSSDITQYAENDNAQDEPKDTNITDMLSKIQDIYDWSQRSTLSAIDSEIVQNVKVLHSSIFSKFSKVSRKKRIESVVPWRKIPSKKLKVSNDAVKTDHLYASIAKPKPQKTLVNIDGSYKIKGRKRAVYDNFK